VLDFASTDHGPDNGIEARAVATTGQYSDSHQPLLEIDGAASLSRPRHPPPTFLAGSAGGDETAARMSSSG
jgi:hypothetical protein